MAVIHISRKCRSLSVQEAFAVKFIEILSDKFFDILFGKLCSIALLVYKSNLRPVEILNVSLKINLSIF